LSSRRSHCPHSWASFGSLSLEQSTMCWVLPASGGQPDDRVSLSSLLGVVRLAVARTEHHALGAARLRRSSLTITLSSLRGVVRLASLEQSTTCWVLPASGGQPRDDLMRSPPQGSDRLALLEQHSRFRCCPPPAVQPDDHIVLTPTAAPRRSARFARTTLQGFGAARLWRSASRSHCPHSWASFGSLSLEQSATRWVLPASGGPA
jgi:hypothetical protein